MGVKNLWDILESCKQTLPLHHLQNKRLCVDLSCWMVQFQSAIKSHNCVKEKMYLRTLFHRVRALIALNCSLIFVTDGSIPSIKLSAYRRRLGSALEVIEGEINSQTVKSLRRNTGSEFSCMIREAKDLGIALGIPCLDGLEEAEAQCASLNSASLCDGCFTLDSDIFLFGARTVYRDILLGESGYVTCYEMVDIERKLGFGRNSLITLALLLGSDYSQGVHGFGPETACRVVKSVGDETILHQIVSEGLVIARKTRGTKKTTKVLDSDANKENDSLYKQNIHDNRNIPGPDNQFRQVISAYMKPKCHSPDSEAVQRVCTQHPFLRVQLQQICEQAFGWSHSQTDQYILPKVAERDLRRFANLRFTSSELGVRLPLHKIPVPCPVFAIVKQRKLKGRECFEVSWHGVDGLQTSVVPADLLERACPEKIAEFIEKKAEGKKQNRKPRARKSTKAGVSEVDLQLQGLMLSIESESHGLDNSKFHHATGVSNLQSNPIHRMGKHHQNISLTESQNNVFPDTSKCHQNTSLSIESPSNLFLDTSKYHQNTCPRTELQRNVLLDAIGHFRAAVPKGVEPEVIDLSTPSPPPRKCESAINRHVNVIDLSDSESDASPKHEQKARELRLFLDSIKEDLH